MSKAVGNDTTSNQVFRHENIEFQFVPPDYKREKKRKDHKFEQEGDFLHYVFTPISEEVKPDMQEQFWHESPIKKTIGITAEYRPERYMSLLQQRLEQQTWKKTTGPSFKELPAEWKAYFLLTAISEHEQDQGGDDDGYKSSMVGDSYWTSYEKNRFFVALDRCGRHRVHDIAKRVGPTKTTQEVIVYLNILDQLSKINPKEKSFQPDLCAREMSPMFIMQEEKMASQLVQHLETESYKKHLELVLNKQYENTQQMFDLWRMTSITKELTGEDDMTLLISSIVQYHQLLRGFVGDIITTLYTEMTNEKDKTVTRRRIQRVLAKRRQTWKSLFTQRPDPRFKKIDERSLVVGKRLFRAAFPRKNMIYTRRREWSHWEVKKLRLNDGSVKLITNQVRVKDEVSGQDDDDSHKEVKEEEEEHEESEEENNEEDDEEDSVESDSDTALSEESDDSIDEVYAPFDYTANHESENEISENLGSYGLQLGREKIENNSSDDDQIESQNILLDKDYEKKLSVQLGFVMPK